MHPKDLEAAEMNNVSKPSKCYGLMLRSKMKFYIYCYCKVFATKRCNQGIELQFVYLLQSRISI